MGVLNNDRVGNTSEGEREDFVLSIICSKPGSTQAKITRLVEEWLKRHELELLAKSRSFTVAIANVWIPDCRKEEILTDFKRQRGEWYEQHGCDVNICSSSLGKAIRAKNDQVMFIFDMDSTLIQMECIDELARMAGIAERISKITRDAMNGLYDFSESLCLRLALLKGLKVDWSLLQQKAVLALTSGARDLAKFLKAHNVKTAIVSGGFSPIADHLCSILDFDKCFANTLETVDDKLTGCLLGDCIDAEGKARILRDLARGKFSRVVAVGDGANDLKMIAEASPYGVAFCAKPIVAHQVLML